MCGQQGINAQKGPQFVHEESEIHQRDIKWEEGEKEEGDETRATESNEEGQEEILKCGGYG